MSDNFKDLERGWKAFWKRRGMKPPPSSRYFMREEDPGFTQEEQMIEEVFREEAMKRGRPVDPMHPCPTRELDEDNPWGFDNLEDDPDATTLFK